MVVPMKEEGITVVYFSLSLLEGEGYGGEFIAFLDALGGGEELWFESVVGPASPSHLSIKFMHDFCVIGLLRILALETDAAPGDYAFEAVRGVFRGWKEV